MADYTDPGLAIKKLASNVRNKMDQKADTTALASKVDKPATGDGLKVWDATSSAWVDAPATGTAMTTVSDADLEV